MNKEEKKVIKSMKEFAYTIYGTLSIKEAQIVLNLLEKKDKESHFIQSELDIANAKIIKLNKIIDLMGEKIFEEGIVWENKEDVKQYFERKVENGN